MTGTQEAAVQVQDATNQSELKQQQDQEIIATFSGKSEEEIRKMVYEDPELAPKLDRLVELIEEQANNPQPAQLPARPAATAPQGQAQSPEQGVVIEDKDVSVTIRPSWLGSYAVNRPLPEAIQELVRGKTEADRTIAFFKDHKVPHLERETANVRAENASLKKELENWKKRQQQAQQPNPGAQPAAIPEIPSLPDEIDFLDPEHQKTVSAALKASAQTIKEFGRIINDLKNPQSATPQVPETPSAPQAPAAQSYEQEFAEIRMMQANPEFAGVLSTKTDVAELDRQYSEYVKNLAMVMGVQQVITPDGRYTPEVIRLLTEVDSQTSPQSQLIRERLEANNVRPPEELNTLRTIYQIRGERGRYLTRDNSGSAVPIGYDETARIFLARNPSLRQQVTAPQPTPMEQHEARARAEQNRQQFTREPRPGEGAAPADNNQAELEEFNRLLNKGRAQLTQAEGLQMRDYLKRLVNMSDGEIDAWFRPIR